ncbi:hypothetical protein JW887_00885 [Candidatus Dojkabacteria bacterium]|nr:hypothetical protein [Candidatus Dojkabacteria bacterium]
MSVKDEVQKLVSEYEQGIWYDYSDIHEHSKVVTERMRGISKKIPMFISIGRGGWLASRLIATNFERMGLETVSFSVISKYINSNSSREQAVLAQSLDNESKLEIKRKLKTKKYDLWIVDAPFVTGGTMTMVKKYIQDLFNTVPKTVALHVVEYVEIVSAPWRKAPTYSPDVYAEKIRSNTVSWYVQYPWEWSNYKAYCVTCEVYKLGLGKDALANKLKTISNEDRQI